MRKGQVVNVSYLKDRRKELRKSLTPAEASLWLLLKGGKLKGRKFRRQHSIENYIVDFCCPAEKIIIELDGQGHFETGADLRDFDRDERLKQLGYLVLRFENKVLFERPENVLFEIERHFKE